MRRDRPKIDPYDDDMWARLARQAASSLPTFLDFAPPSPPATPAQPAATPPKPASPASQRQSTPARPPTPTKGNQPTDARSKPNSELKAPKPAASVKSNEVTDARSKPNSELKAPKPAASVKSKAAVKPSPAISTPKTPLEAHSKAGADTPVPTPASAHAPQPLPVEAPQSAPLTPSVSPQLEPEPADEAKTSARSRQKTTRYKGISRIDHKRTHGYFARVSWEGRVHSKLFSDKKHGDRLAALAAALEWRDEMEKQLGKPRTEEMVFGKAVAGSSKIGIHKRVKDGRLVYEATWREGQKVKRTSYSIRKHGEKKARALAIAARERAQARKLAARYGEAAGT